MAYVNSAYKVLGQSAPSAANYGTALYTVPSSTATVLSTISVTTRSSSSDTFRLRIAVAGASQSNQQWLAYDIPINGNSVAPLYLGITLSAGDVVYAGSSGGTCTFQAFGNELS